MLPAGFGEELEGRLQAGAVLAAAVGDGQAEGAVQHLRLHVLGEGRQQRALARIGRPAGRGQIGALEEALRALVDAGEQAAVDPFDVEQQDRRRARTRASANIGRRVLNTSAGMPEGRRDVELALDDAPVAHGGEVVAVDPAARIVLRPHVDLAGLEGLEQRRGVAEVVEADLVEVEAPARSPAGRGAHQFGIATIGDGAAGVDACRPCRARCRSAAPAWCARRSRH